MLPEIDGCPWFGEACSMPKGWGWRFVSALMASRYDRMKKACNRGEDIWDTPDNIFVECIFVACVTKGTIDE